VWAALLTRRGLGLTLLMVVVVLACLWLGRWQWSRAQPDPLPPSASGGPAPLSSVLAPRSPFLREDLGRLVEVSGRYLPGSELVVVQRSPAAAHGGQGDDTGVWALSALRTDSGAVLPVVRGWAAGPTDVTPPPRGEQTVRGILQPSEDSASAPPTADGALAPDEVTTVSSAVLVGLYPTDQLYDGFLLLEPPSAGLQQVDPDVVATSGWHLVNTGYALQWWVFAGFTVFMWLRLLRDQADDARPRDDETTDSVDQPTKELA
jgi:cytochrome oxidase assembly protein ShyY1